MTKNIVDIMIKQENKNLKNQIGCEPEILKNVYVTEKSTNLIAENNQYIFRVFSRTNKISIKKAIQDFYKVNVVSMKIVKIPSKKKKIPKMPTKFGWKKGMKKVIVKLKPGEKIEF